MVDFDVVGVVGFEVVSVGGAMGVSLVTVGALKADSFVFGFIVIAFVAF